MTSQLSYRKFVSVFIGICLLPLLFAPMLVFVVDPLQIYRRAPYRPQLSTVERYQLPGLATNYKYDTVVLGTSHTQNFSPRQIQEVLGWDSLKLAMSGSTAHEQNLLLGLALQTGRLRRAMWGIDMSSFWGGARRVRDEQGPFPYYLYDSSILTDIGPYWLSRDQIEASIRILRTSCCDRVDYSNEILEQYNVWYLYYKIGRRELLADANKSWCAENKTASVASGYAPDDLRESLEQNLVRPIREHPGINFLLFFPPYSVLAERIKYEHDPELFENTLRFKAAIYDMLKFSNVQVYDFQNDLEVTHSLDDYKDLSHFSEKISRRIVEQIKNEHMRVTRKDAVEKLKQFEADVKSFRLPASVVACAGR